MEMALGETNRVTENVISLHKLENYLHTSSEMHFFKVVRHKYYVWR